MNISHLDPKGGMVGKFSVAAHVKAIEKTDLVTGNDWEVLPLHDVTVIIPFINSANRKMKSSGRKHKKLMNVGFC